MNDDFILRFKGRFTGILRWEQLDTLWEQLRNTNDGQWYIYHVGEQPPIAPNSSVDFVKFIDQIDHLLRQEHKEDYCGVVYADNPEQPTYVKIFDPNNLGVVCGFSNSPPMPAWIISRLQPQDLPNAFPPPQNRKRWWQRLFA